MTWFFVELLRDVVSSKVRRRHRARSIIQIGFQKLTRCVCGWMRLCGTMCHRRCVQGFKGKGKGGKDKGGKDKRKGGASFASPEEREAKMAKVECYKCHKLGHYSTSCPS